jgi:hypothetical protein
MDTNRELFRIDFDLDTGEVVETGLTDNSDGVPPSRMGADPDDDFFAALSPDGEFLYYENHLRGVWDIYRILATGTSGEHPVLTPSDSNDRFVAL